MTNTRCSFDYDAARLNLDQLDQVRSELLDHLLDARFQIGDLQSTIDRMDDATTEDPPGSLHTNPQFDLG